MHLADLLCLARTTKAFRELVMSRDARRFWNAAMENSKADGIPACPVWLGLPAYANLLYSPHCHVRELETYDVEVSERSLMFRLLPELFHWKCTIHILCMGRTLL